MLVYISGPMKGKPDLNRETFLAMQESMARRNIKSINPHDYSPERLPQESDNEYYARCLLLDWKLLDLCDAIIMLPDWEKSNGAKSEYARAKINNIPILKDDFY